MKKIVDPYFFSYPNYSPVIVRLSLLTMTNPIQLCDVLYLCVLRWLMKPILACIRLYEVQGELL